VSVQIARDSEGRFRGFARVKMETLEAAKDAKDQLDGTELNGRTILVAFDGPQWPQ
jgi:RNA recognition motif-containing protein